MNEWSSSGGLLRSSPLPETECQTEGRRRGRASDRTRDRQRLEPEMGDTRMARGRARAAGGRAREQPTTEQGNRGQHGSNPLPLLSLSWASKSTGPLLLLLLLRLGERARSLALSGARAAEGGESGGLGGGLGGGTPFLARTISCHGRCRVCSGGGARGRCRLLLWERISVKQVSE